MIALAGAGLFTASSALVIGAYRARPRTPSQAEAPMGMSQRMADIAQTSGYLFKEIIITSAFLPFVPFLSLTAKADLLSQEAGFKAAVAFRCFTMMRVFVWLGEDIEARNVHGETAWMRAASQGDEAVVRALIELGADVNAQTHNGMTALIVAAIQNFAGVVKAILYSARANIDFNFEQMQISDPIRALLRRYKDEGGQAILKRAFTEGILSPDTRGINTLKGKCLQVAVRDPHLVAIAQQNLPETTRALFAQVQLISALLL